MVDYEMLYNDLINELDEKDKRMHDEKVQL